MSLRAAEPEGQYIKDGQLDGLSDETLATCFELKLRFFGNTVNLESCESLFRKTTIKMLNIALA